jgi:crotonobetainyl-CoA:carnitine CoA-transferase CaiB-like acyl-CoA transferase
MSDTMPLSRFRVIDMTQARAGPTAVRLMADWGADVTLIEPPLETGKNRAGLTGTRHEFDFQNLHRNKRSITLNLKTEEGKEVFFKLVKEADVLIENYRSTVKHKLGVDYETVRKVNPRLVYASISGFGQSGPYNNRHGVDQIAQGMGGLMSVTGEPGSGPMRVGVPISDLCAGMFLAHGVLMALLDREVTGEGQWVHTSLLESMINMMDLHAARWLVKGEVSKSAGNNHPTGIPMGLFEANDGYIVVAGSGNLYPRFCKAVGLDELIDHPDYNTVEKRSDNRDALNKIIQEKFNEYSIAELTEILIEAGVPCGPVNTIDQVFDNPQVKHLKMSRTQEHPTLGNLDLVGSAINLSNAPKPDTFKRHTPEAGEHTAEILGELGYSSDAIEALQSKKVI